MKNKENLTINITEGMKRFSIYEYYVYIKKICKQNFILIILLSIITMILIGISLFLTNNLFHSNLPLNKILSNIVAILIYSFISVFMIWVCKNQWVNYKKEIGAKEVLLKGLYGGDNYLGNLYGSIDDKIFKKEFTTISFAIYDEFLYYIFFITFFTTHPYMFNVKTKEDMNNIQMIWEDSLSLSKIASTILDNIIPYILDDYLRTDSVTDSSQIQDKIFSCFHSDMEELINSLNMSNEKRGNIIEKFFTNCEQLNGLKMNNRFYINLVTNYLDLIRGLSIICYSKLPGIQKGEMSND